jgi:type II secretory pathway predicted ATPase ExeA
VVQLALTGQEVYLLVDDAEQLDESALEALLAWRPVRRKVVRMCSCSVSRR